jgi:hypothetical protein
MPGDATRARRRDRWSLFIAGTVVLALAIALTGCAQPCGQSEASAKAQVHAIPGLTYVALEVLGNGGFPPPHTASVVVQVAEGASIPDRVKLFNYLASVAWSMNQTKPDTMIFINIKSDDPEQFDWASFVRQNGWGQASGDSNVLLRVDDAQKHFGPWPGKVPAVPTSPLIVISPSATPAPTPSP